MYDFFYDFVQLTWGDRAEVLFTDTDSLALQVQTEDLYKDIEPHIESWFDTSKLKPGNRQGLPPGKNSRVVGKFKDEEPNDVITDFVGIRAKNYGYKTLGGAKKKEDKGIKKAVIKKEITFDDCKDCVLNGVVKHDSIEEPRGLHRVPLQEGAVPEGRQADCPRGRDPHTSDRTLEALEDLGFEERKALESVIEGERKDLREREALRECEAQRKIEAEKEAKSAAKEAVKAAKAAVKEAKVVAKEPKDTKTPKVRSVKNKQKMGCKNSKHNDSTETFDEQWDNKTGLCLAIRFESGEEKSLGLKCGIEKRGYHTKRESKEKPTSDEEIVWGKRKRSELEEVERESKRMKGGAEGPEGTEVPTPKLEGK